MISKKVTYGLLICFLGILPATVFAYVPEPIPPPPPAHVYASDFDFYGYLTSGGLSKTYHNDGSYFIVAPICIPIPLLPPLYFFEGFIDFDFSNVYADTLLLDYTSFLYKCDVTIYYTSGLPKFYSSLNGGYREISLDSNRRVSQITFRYWHTTVFFHLAEIKVDLLVLLC